MGLRKCTFSCTPANRVHKNSGNNNNFQYSLTNQDSPEVVELKILMESVIGRSIVNYYKMNNILNDANKNELTNLIIQTNQIK